MQEREWKCSVCDKVLSTKYRLAYHIQHIHKVSVDNVKRYKLYTVDQSLPIPRTTLYRRKHCKSVCNSSSPQSSIPELSPQYVPSSELSYSAGESPTSVVCNACDTEHEHDFVPSVDNITDGTGYDHGNNSSSDSNTCNVDPGRNTCILNNPCDRIIPGSDSTSNSEEANLELILHSGDCIADVSESETNSDMEASDTETNSDSNCYLDSDSETDSDTGEHIPAQCAGTNTMSEGDQACLVLLSCLMKHRLSGQASEDILHAFNLVSPGSGNSASTITLAKLKETMGACNVNIVDFCSTCYTLFPTDETIINCALPNCPGLRFKGSSNEQSRRQRKCYFACLNIENQLKDILEREGVWLAMQQYRRGCESDTDISDILNGQVYRSLCQRGNFLNNKNNLSLLFNTDGIPLYKSSSISIWPVYLVVNELPPAMRFSKLNVILWGIWQAQHKPVFRTFFQPFVQQMIKLKTDGLVLRLNNTEILCKLIVIAGTLDLQAKAIILEMTHHNGQFGCLTCEEPGKVVAQGRGHCRVYPYRAEPATERSTTGVLECAMEGTARSPVRGMKGISCLFGMEWFDIVYGMVPDYMHSTLLGVTKKMVTLMFTTPYSKEPYYVGRSIKMIDARLMSMKPTDEVARLPRKMEKNIQHLKATELEMWLLFYAIPCLIGILEDKYLNHFALLVEGVYILLGDSINVDKLKRAEDVLKTFYRQFASLYGEKHCTLNLHNVCQHLVTYVRKLGPLWSWSCFPFEDMNGNLLNYVHGTGDVCRQILWRMQAEKRLSVDVEQMSNSIMKNFVKKMISVGRHVNGKVTANCRIAGGLSRIVLENAMEKKLKVCLQLNPKEDIGNLFQAARIVMNETVYFSESYTRLKKRVAHIVLVILDGNVRMAVVKYYVYHEKSNKCVAVINMIEMNIIKPFVHPLVNHLITVSKQIQPEEIIIPVNSVKEKLLYLSGNKVCCCVARLPNLHHQCC